MADLATFTLKKESVADAYALVRTGVPTVSREGWIAHAERLIGAGGGVLAAAVNGGSLLGLAGYRCDSDLRHERVLRVDPLVACELGAGGPVRRALIDSLIRIAGLRGCDALLVTGPCACAAEDGARRLDAWRRLGLEPETLVLGRTLR